MERDTVVYYTCQFCGEQDFDIEGLWFHYDNRNCEAYRLVGIKASGLDSARGGGK